MESVVPSSALRSSCRWRRVKAIHEDGEEEKADNLGAIWSKLATGEAKVARVTSESASTGRVNVLSAEEQAVLLEAMKACDMVYFGACYATKDTSWDEARAKYEGFSATEVEAATGRIDIDAKSLKFENKASASVSTLEISISTLNMSMGTLKIKLSITISRSSSRTRRRRRRPASTARR